MRFDPPLLAATLLQRYKRFLADVELADGSTVTVHCPNTGRMTGCAEPGSEVWLSESPDPRRKYRFTWELTRDREGHLVYIHSARANRLVGEALADGRIDELAGYSRVAAEVPIGDAGSRADFRLSDDVSECFVEVKCVTLHSGGGIGCFPDAVSTRGARHLRELARAHRGGSRAVLCFCVHHPAVREVRPADAIDPAYGRALREAVADGVEVIARRARVAVDGVVLGGPLPVVIPA